MDIRNGFVKGIYRGYNIIWICNTDLTSIIDVGIEWSYGSCI